MISAPGGDFADIGVFGAQVREIIESAKDHPEAYDRRVALLRKAQEVEDGARCEVSFGMFAESSAGKSLLVGTLLGDPLLLPVAARTVTCNITVLRLRPAEIPVACIMSARAEYLDAGELDGYARHLLGVAVAQIDAHGGDASSLRGLAPQWSSLASARTALEDGPATRLPPNALSALRTEIEEMIGAANAARESGVEPGAVETVTVEQLRELVDHGVPGGATSTLGLRRSMVRRIVADVDVPAAIWPPTLLHGAQLRLVDVPGSASGRRPIRDDHLRIRELDAVDIALFFLESRPSSLADARELQDLMSRGNRGPAQIRDSVLVVAGKFDRLEQAPAVLLVPPRVPPEEAAVLERAPTLNDLVTAARGLLPPKRDDRIFFVSPIVAIANADDVSQGWQVGEVVTKLAADQAVVDARARVADWLEVGRIPGALGSALHEFTTDGGLDALRRAMIRHAAEHGVDLLMRRLRADADNLHADMERFLQLRADLGPVLDVDSDVRDLFENVLGEISARMTALRKVARIELADAEAGEPSPAAMVRAEVERAVYDWPEWKLLFAAVEDGRVVVTPVSTRKDRWASLRSSSGGAVPVLASDFLASFEGTCWDIRANMVKRIVNRFDQFARSCVLVMPEERALIDRVFASSALRDVLSRTADGATLMELLDEARSLTMTMADIAERVQELGATANEDVAESLPVDPDRALPWHPESPRRHEPNYSGEPQLLRLRREMIRAATRDSLRILTEGLAVAASELRAQLSGMSGALDDVKNDSARWIVTVTEATNRADGGHPE